MLKKHSITIRGHRTSFSLEDAFFDELRQIANEDNISIDGLITRIDSTREPEQNLSSAVRLYILKRLRKKLS
jgi:predicted DNA-binding ribbon-helix-helix protein